MDEAKFARVTNQSGGPRYLNTATGPLMILAGAMCEDYFSEAEIKAMRATGVLGVETVRGKEAEERHKIRPKLGDHAMPAKRMPGAKDKKRKA